MWTIIFKFRHYCPHFLENSINIQVNLEINITTNNYIWVINQQPTSQLHLSYQNTNNQHSNQHLHLNYQNTLKENMNLLTQSIQSTIKFVSIYLESWYILVLTRSDLDLICHSCILGAMYEHPNGPTSLRISAPNLFAMMQAVESSISGIN